MWSNFNTFEIILRQTGGGGEQENIFLGGEWPLPCGDSTELKDPILGNRFVLNLKLYCKLVLRQGWHCCKCGGDYVWHMYWVGTLFYFGTGFQETITISISGNWKREKKIAIRKRKQHSLLLAIKLSLFVVAENQIKSKLKSTFFFLNFNSFVFTYC